MVSIENDAFYGCSNLASVTLNSQAVLSETYIGDKLGYQVKEYIIGNGVTSIGDFAFCYCDSLTSITIPKSVVSIGNYAFRGCSSMKSITIPDNVTKIGEWAFDGCNGLKTISIGKNVTKIGDEAFFDCNELTKIQVDSRNPVYDSRNDCNAIIEKRKYTIFSGLEIITFDIYVLIKGCMNTIIPNGVDAIGLDAFNGCKGLFSVIIPQSVESIPEGVFSGCSNLASISVESENRVYDSRENCNAIIEKASNKLIAGCMNSLIPNNVEEIGKQAFYGCSGLTSLSIPASVKKIGDASFGGCSGLTSIRVESDNPVYDSRLNCNAIIEKNGEVLIAGCMNTIIPDGVNCIKNDAFNGCTGLTSIIIPASVKKIGYYAFSDCTSLTTVIIGRGISEIETCAFYGCNALKDVVCLADKAPTTESTAFYESPIINAILYVPETSVNEYHALSPWDDFGKIEALADNDYTTAVNVIPNNTLRKKTVYYDLNGRRVIQPAKGLYIKNGKKILMQ